MPKKIFITSNPTQASQNALARLQHKLIEEGFQILDEITSEVDLIIAVGGDGAFINAVHEFNYPKAPIVGINTGHLGFLQDISPADIDKFISEYKAGEYYLMPISIVKAHIDMGFDTEKIYALNELVIRNTIPRMIHLDMEINHSFIESFSGDGLLISTSTGSTAYNYSAGGSIVDPSLELLQITPLSPSNTNAYRSLTSSIVTAPDSIIEIIPQTQDRSSVQIVRDGFDMPFEEVRKITITSSKDKIQVLRLHNYDFWSKVTSRFL